MKYEVLWDARAEADLAAVWLAAADRYAAPHASTWFDDQLTRSPLQLGESRVFPLRQSSVVSLVLAWIVLK